MDNCVERNLYCHSCKSIEIRTKEIEIRYINSQTMSLDARHPVLEIECQHCGWIGSVEQSSSKVLVK